MNKMQFGIFLLILLFIPVCVVAQTPAPRPDDQLTPSNIKKNNITGFTETWIWNPEDRKTRKELLVHEWKYNSEGQPVYHWSVGMDLVKSIDSVTYTYNGYGQLARVNQYTKYPVDVEDKQNYRLTRPSDTVVIEYIYGRDKYLAKEVIHDYNQLNKHDTTFYQNDRNGNVVFADNSRLREVNLYTANGKLSKKTKYPKKYVVAPDGFSFRITDTLVLEYIYDKENRLAKIDSEIGKTTYVYNDKGQVAKVFETGRIYGKPYDYKFEFQYDDKGNLIEMKKYKSDVLWDWERYEYNKYGLCEKQYWLNVDTKEVEIEVIREFEFE